MGMKICSVCGWIFDPVTYKECECNFCNINLIDTEIPRQDYYKELRSNPDYKEELLKKYVYPLGQYSNEKHMLHQIKSDEERKKRAKDLALKRYREQQAKNKPIITCPYCQSTNVKKIDFLDRGLSIGLFGLASNKINKSFQCKRCKGTW